MIQKDMPLVSVGIPIYNRPEGLRRTLECFVNQTYVNIEIIIADNCSPDPEVEKIAREYVAKDDRISYFRHEENKGWGYNTNFVIDKAKGDYFLRATDDDWWDVTYVHKIMKLMVDNPNVSLGLSNFIEVDIYGKKSSYHLADHLPLLQAFTTSNRVENIRNYVAQFEGFGKSNLYFSIFKTQDLRSDFVKTTLEHEVLAGDLLINLYCLFRGDLVVCPEVLLKLTFDNVKFYEGNQLKNKAINLLLLKIDHGLMSSRYNKWINYLITVRKLINESNYKWRDKQSIKMILLDVKYCFIMI